MWNPFRRRQTRTLEALPEPDTIPIKAEHNHSLDFLDSMRADIACWQERHATVCRAIDELMRERDQLEQLLAAARSAMDMLTDAQPYYKSVEFEAAIGEVVRDELAA